MAGKDDDEDFDFSDHDLDALPDNTLQELEAAAILSTQHVQKTSLSAHTRPDSLQAAGYSGVAHTSYAQVRDPAFVPNPPSDDFGFEDEDVIDLDEEPVQVTHIQNGRPIESPGLVDGPAKWAPTIATHLRAGPTQTYRPALINRNPPKDANTNGIDRSGSLYQDRHVAETMEEDDAPDMALQDLRARLQELEQERLGLLKSVEDANSAAMAKAGEIAIVRRNQDKTTKEYERRIAVMQHAHADVIAKQKAELERTRRDREQMETNNMFLEHDLAREAERAKRAKRIQEAAETNPRSVTGSPNLTPTKQKSLSCRDGFVDDDILLISPSKNRDKIKAATPKQGAKRKRPMTDQSPVPPLQLSEPKEDSESEEPVELDIDAGLLQNVGKEDDRFQLLQRLMGHRLRGGLRIFEVLTKHSFPSQKNKMLSSIIYDELSYISTDPDSFGSGLCSCFLTLWDRCLDESYCAPVQCLIDSVQFILASDKLATAIAVTDKALPVIIKTIDQVALPIVKASVNPAYMGERDTPANVKLRQDIDVVECLYLLHTIATSCVSSQEAITRLWKYMPTDFVLIMLNRAQPLSQIVLMLQILATSSLPDTLGPIVPADSAPDQQAKRETDIVERLVLLLFETPEVLNLPDSKHRPYSAASFCDLRLQVLRVLEAICVEDHGSQMLAGNRHCIGRLVRFLHDQIDSLYTYNSQTHFSIIESINLSTRLLYHLMTSFSEGTDLEAKLAVVPGGSHKHLIALTRLAFTDALVLEEGIAEETVHAAHQLLNDFLSPEEGEALVQIYSSARSGG